MFHETGTGLPRIVLLFVFQNDVSAIVGVAENLGKPLEVGRLLLLAIGTRDHDLDLHVQRVGSNFGQVAVNVFRMKIARIQVDSKPGALDGLESAMQNVSTSEQVVIVDAVGKRSNVAARYLHLKGYANVVRLSGDVDQWIKDRFPIGLPKK